MTTRMKLAALIGVCSMYGVFAACGGGGGGDDGAGHSAQAQGQCFQVPTACSDGTQSVKAAVESKDCPYYCGQVVISVGTTTETNTVTATRTETATK
ncbi:MAG: hypothetical protein ACXWQO_00950 [Bdellovibrionota bacterium]